MTGKRLPGWILFAVVLMFIVAAFNLLSGISIWLNADWLAGLKMDMGDNLWIVGVVDLVIAAGCLVAGFSLLKGGKFGYYWAMIFAVCNAVKWFFMIPGQPFTALLVVALDMLIIFALIANPEWFGLSFLGESSPPMHTD